MKLRHLSALWVSALFLASCQDLFTTSLAAPLARESGTVYAKVSLEGLEEAIEQARSSSEDAAALLLRVEDLAQGASPADSLVCAQAATTLAASSLNLVSFLGELFEAASAENPEELSFEDLLEPLSSLGEVETALVAILPAPESASWDDFTSAVPEQELLLTGIAILLAEARDAINPDTYVENFDFASSGMNEAESLATALILEALQETPTDILSALLGSIVDEGEGEL